MTLSGFEPLPYTSLLHCRPATQPIELLNSLKDWVSRGVLIPLFYGTSLSQFQDNSPELFNRSLFLPIFVMAGWAPLLVDIRCPRGSS